MSGRYKGGAIHYGRGIFFAEDEQIEPMKCHIVYGPPAGGKTTYVKQHKKDGDLVVDLDYIRQAVSLEGKMAEQDNLLAVALSIREHLYELIERRMVDCTNVWIIAGLPRKSERTALRKRLRADLIFIDTEYAECIRRSDMDPERQDKEKARTVIERWFALYEE